MLYILHYFLFNLGLPAVIILLTLFLQTHSDASLTEIGTLLMVLPFLSTVIKPFICALADRQQAHKQYLMAMLALYAFGYGSLVIFPFFPDFSKEHSRLVWALDVVLIAIGFSAFSVIWSLGDAMAVNMARIKGVPWGSYRAWGTFAWGVGGCIIGQINENPLLPKYTPALLMMALASLVEIVMLAFWPNKDFSMGDSLDGEPVGGGQHAPGAPTKGQLDQDQLEANWPQDRSQHGTLSGSVRANPRLVSAVANIVMEDLGSTLKSSLRFGTAQKRAGLADILEQHQLKGGQMPPLSPVLSRTRELAPESPAGTLKRMQQSPLGQLQGESDSRAATIGKAALRRTQMALSRMNSLSAASGHAIADELLEGGKSGAEFAAASPQRQQVMLMSSLAGRASLSKASSALALKESGPLAGGLGEQTAAAAAAASDKAEDLQLVLLKLIVRRDSSILRYCILFVVLGLLMIIHITYFFLHVEKLCSEQGYDFSKVAGYYLIAQSASEVFSFLVIVPYYVPRVGRVGSLVTAAAVYLARYAYYGTYLSHFSPYWALVFETAHGIAYGIAYQLVTEIAAECVNKVDIYLPELIERKIVPATINPSQLKLPLRATMQGIFSGAYDGLGNGIGVLFAGIWLDHQPYESLWLVCAAISLAIMLIYPLTELRSCRRPST